MQHAEGFDAVGGNRDFRIIHRQPALRVEKSKDTSSGFSTMALTELDIFVLSVRGKSGGMGAQPAGMWDSTATPISHIILGID